MRTVLYEPTIGQLMTFLHTQLQALPIDLYAFTLQNGTVLRYASSDVGLTVAGVTFAAGPALSRSRTKFSVGIAVDTLDMSIAADASVQVGGVALISAIAAGLFDAADVRIAHAFLDGDLQVQGVVLAFAGRVGEIQTQRGQATLQVRSYSELFDIMVPGDLYQPGCRNTLYDSYCKQSRSAAKASGAVVGGITAANNAFSTPDIPITTSMPPGMPAAYWADMGVVSFITGANTGISRTVKRQSVAGSVSTLEFVSPYPYPIQIGDAFDCFPGCDKTLFTCTNKWANKANFRGEPFVPAPETVV